MGIDVAQGLVAESSGKCADGGEAVLFPEGYGGEIGADDDVELHRVEAEGLCLAKGMLAHQAADAFSACCGCDHVAGVRDVGTATGLIGFEEVAAEDLIAFDSDVGMGSEPIGEEGFVSGAGFEDVGITGGDDFTEDLPHGLGVLFGGGDDADGWRHLFE